MNYQNMWAWTNFAHILCVFAFAKDLSLSSNDWFWTQHCKINGQAGSFLRFDEKIKKNMPCVFWWGIQTGLGQKRRNIHLASTGASAAASPLSLRVDNDCRGRALRSPGAYTVCCPFGPSMKSKRWRRWARAQKLHSSNQKIRASRRQRWEEVGQDQSQRRKRQGEDRHVEKRPGKTNPSWP